MTPTRVTPHLSAHAMVAQQTHIQVKCLHECHMSCMKCHRAHIPSHSPTPSHMHMLSVKTSLVLPMTHVSSPHWLHYPMQVPMGNQSRVNPDSYLTTRNLCDKHDRVSSLGNRTFRITSRVSYTRVTELFGSHCGSLTPMF